jgi:hypothetical protein
MLPSRSTGVTAIRMTTADHMHEVTLSIGRCCVQWTNIEFELHELCINLSRFHHDMLGSPEAVHVLTVAFSVMSLSQRIDVAKALAAGCLDPDLYADLERSLDKINGGLREKRNRFVHDSWHLRDETIVRTRYGARVSPERHVRYATEVAYPSPNEVRDFAVQLEDVLARIMSIGRELDAIHNEIGADKHTLQRD